MKKRNRGAPTPAPFALPGDQAYVMLEAYYRQLNRYAAFTSDLTALRDRLALQYPNSDERAVPQDEDEDEGPWEANDAWLPEAARSALLAFVTRWRLPPESARDTMHALLLSGNDPQPKIAAYFRTQIGSGPYVFVRADAPEAWVYNPVGPTPAVARRRARAAGDAVYHQMLGQIERAEAEWHAEGRKPLPPRRRSTPDLDEGARRLFQRVVLRWNWKQIADDAAQRRRAYDEGTVADGVKKWAQQIGVPLP